MVNKNIRFFVVIYEVREQLELFLASIYGIKAQLNGISHYFSSKTGAF